MTIIPDGMGKWKCHKEVYAAKINLIELSPTGLPPGSALFHLEGVKGTVVVFEDWLNKHLPIVGGYYVVYEDGYTSYSPADAFVNGYTPIISVDNDTMNKIVESYKETPGRIQRFPRTKMNPPRVGYLVHYVPIEMPILCLAALITRTEDTDDMVALKIFYPKGMFHIEGSDELSGVPFDRERAPGTWHYIGH